MDKYIKEKGLENVITDPSRVLNADESKNVYTIYKGSSKENITVMFTFSANGDICGYLREFMRRFRYQLTRNAILVAVTMDG